MNGNEKQATKAIESKESKRGTWLSVYFMDAEAQPENVWDSEEFSSHVVFHLSDDWNLHEVMADESYCDPDDGCFRVQANILKALFGKVKQALKDRMEYCLYPHPDKFSEFVAGELMELAEKGTLYYKWKVAHF